MRFVNPNLLLSIGMGDAYAVATEYLRPEELSPVLAECLRFEHYVPHPRYALGKGRYTDDTEMSVANARVLIKNDSPFTPLMFADEYVREFVRGGRRKGYAAKFQEFLEKEALTGELFLERVHPLSCKNGAAMRSVPIGVLPDVKTVLSAAETHARITHNTPDGIFSARIVSLMAHYSLYESGPLGELPEYCIANLPDEDRILFEHVFKTRWPGIPVTPTKAWSVAVNTVHAVLDLVAHQPSLMAILRQTLLWGGDTDSVAAIAWGIASSRYQDEVLPAFMRADLEADHPETDADYLEIIGAVLMEKYAE